MKDAGEASDLIPRYCDPGKSSPGYGSRSVSSCPVNWCSLLSMLMIMFQLHHQPWLRVNYEDNNGFLSHFCKRSECVNQL